MKITRRRRHVTEYFDTCDFCDTGHSDGKNICTISQQNKKTFADKFLTRLIAASIKFVELRAKIWDGRNMH